MSRLRRLIAPLLAIAVTAAAAPALAASDGSSTPASTPEAEAAAVDGFFWQLTMSQEVTPGSNLLPLAQRHPGSTGTRSDAEFFKISAAGSNDVPSAALAAYQRAAVVLAKEQPGCQIPWTLLAAIGRVESNHGRFGGAQLGTDGVSRPAIRGPQLNGAGPVAAISDSDQGVMDGDKVWDRAVGPMQFLPSTWRSVARDGDANGTQDPNDIDDAAIGSALYLCGAGGSLATPEGVARAAFRYNHSDYYVQLVMSFQNGYATGVFAEPSPPPPPTKAVKTKATKKPNKTTGTATPTPSSTPKPTPKPTTVPTPKPTPTPRPQVGDFTGIVRVLANGSYTLDHVTLDLGGDKLDVAATFDHDGDAVLETNRQELDGLVARALPVTMHGSKLNGVITVDEIADQPY